MNWFNYANPYRYAPVFGIMGAFGILGGIPPLIVGVTILFLSFYTMYKDGIFNKDYFVSQDNHSGDKT